jgi:hypothetical protein
MLTSFNADDLDEVARAHVFFGHQSVGENILQGVRDLVAPRTLTWKHQDIGRNGDPLAKVEAFRAAMLEGLGADADIAIFKLCYADFDRRTDPSALFSRYEESMRELAAARPRTTFVHVTCPLTAVGAGVKTWIKGLLGRAPWGEIENHKRHTYNVRLRGAFRGTATVFDLAAVEAGGEAEAGPTPRLLSRFTDDGGHLNALGRRAAATSLLDVLVPLVRQANGHVSARVRAQR